jgi:hypothetical protein
VATRPTEGAGGCRCGHLSGEDAGLAGQSGVREAVVEGHGGACVHGWQSGGAEGGTRRERPWRRGCSMLCSPAWRVQACRGSATLSRRQERRARPQASVTSTPPTIYSAGTMGLSRSACPRTDRWIQGVPGRTARDTGRGGIRGGLGGRVAWGRAASGRGRPRRRGVVRRAWARRRRSRRGSTSVGLEKFTLPLFERVKLQKVE